MPPTPSPTDERLRDYIARRMRVSHIYQPLKLMELLGRRSPAPAQDVARRILGEDMTQIDYYTERVKLMVGKVLTGNGVTRYERGTYDLVGGVAEGFCAGAFFAKISTGAERGRALSIRMHTMSPPVTLPTDARLQEMAAVIHGVIPGSEVRLFGSRARGTAGPESDIDLLITVPAAWLKGRNRFEVLNQLWGLLARADVSLDLLLYSRQECDQRRNWRSHVIGRALREGRLIDGAV